jgi:hypothetical protein
VRLGALIKQAKNNLKITLAKFAGVILFH